jgi:ribonuclease HI
MAEKVTAPEVLPEPFVKGVSTAGSRKGLFSCGCGGVLHAFCGAGVDSESHPVIGMTWTGEAGATLLRPSPRLSPRAWTLLVLPVPRRREAQGKTKEISGGEQNTTNLRMETTAACVALEMIDEGHIVTVYSDCSYLLNCMRRGWYKRWRENGWLNYRNEPVANRDLWERLLEATQRHQQVRWRKVRGHSKTQGPHKSGNDRADELAVAAKRRQ